VLLLFSGKGFPCLVYFGGSVYAMQQLFTTFAALCFKYASAILLSIQEFPLFT
jgi:hypothetical protein